MSIWLESEYKELKTGARSSSILFLQVQFSDMCYIFDINSIAHSTDVECLIDRGLILLTDLYFL